MKIDRKDILHVANLARLHLNENEIESLTHEMQEIISYVDQLNELDTSTDEAREHILDCVNVLRDDVVLESYDRDSLLKNAPTHNDECLIVPNVVE